MPAPTEKAAQPDEIEQEIDQLTEEFGGYRPAMRALLHDLGAVIADRNASVSAGYVRSTVIRIQRRDT